MRTKTIRAPEFDLSSTCALLAKSPPLPIYGEVHSITDVLLLFRYLSISLIKKSGGMWARTPNSSHGKQGFTD
jgi:hypothetical protein